VGRCGAQITGSERFGRLLYRPALAAGVPLHNGVIRNIDVFYDALEVTEERRVYWIRTAGRIWN